MKWFTHKAVAVAGALAVGTTPAGFIGVLIGSVLPDMIDTFRIHGDRRIWWRIHRQTTHWFGWYLILMVLGLGISAMGLSSGHTAAVVATALQDMARELGLSRMSGVKEAGSKLLGEIVLWIGVGGLVHILLDALTPMGVPLFPQGGKRRIGFKLVKTGGRGEKIFLVVALWLIALQFA